MRDEGKDPNNRINCILLCINSQCPRFNQGIKEVIIEIMNCYPLKKFWEHVIIIKTRVFNDNNKKPGNIENAIKKNKDVTKVMSIKYIDSPYNIKEFYFNLVDDNGNYKTDDNFKAKMYSLLDEVSRKKPFFEDIKILGTEDKEVGNYIITYQIVQYKDFNGKFETKQIEIDSKIKEKVIGKIGPYYDERKYGSEYKKCGKSYQKYIRYCYYLDEKKNKCDIRDQGEPYPRRV